MLYFAIALIALVAIVFLVERFLLRPSREALERDENAAAQQRIAQARAEQDALLQKSARERLYGRSPWLREVDAAFNADPAKIEILFGCHSHREECLPQNYSLAPITDDELRDLNPIYRQFVNDIGEGKGYRVQACTRVTPDGDWNGVVFKVTKETV